MAGRRPKPTHLHKLQGTFNATRHGRGRAGEPIAEGDLHSPPRDLTPAQKDVWRYAIRHAPRGLLKRIDRDVLAIWCEARDRWNTARLMQAKLDESGELKLLIKGPLGLVESEPPPDWWTPLLSSQRSGKVSNGPGTASIYG
jgi:phage terminase small subunit